MITSINIPNNGLSSADEAPLSYFFRYAENHFNALHDLQETIDRGDKVTQAEMDLMRYFADAWLEMTRVQAAKYAPIIVQNRVGSEMLDRLGFSALKQQALEGVHTVGVATKRRRRVRNLE